MFITLSHSLSQHCHILKRQKSLSIYHTSLSIIRHCSGRELWQLLWESGDTGTCSDSENRTMYCPSHCPNGAALHSKEIRLIVVPILPNTLLRSSIADFRSIPHTHTSSLLHPFYTPFPTYLSIGPVQGFFLFLVASFSSDSSDSDETSGV